MNFNRKKMKQTAFLAIVAVVLSCIGCKKEDIHSNELTGTWIEATDKADTLVFFGTESFMLNRGKEMSNGHILPKYGSGIYEYKLQNDSISLYNSISSCYCFNNYYFEIKNGTLKIGDFYRKNLTQQGTLTFVKQ